MLSKDEQIVELKGLLLEVQTTNSKQAAIISEHAQCHSEQACYITELENRIVEMANMITDYDQKLATLSVKKNSNNSSIPPSVDFARKNKSLRISSGRPAGGQMGHTGHHLPLRDHADVVIKLSPDCCSGCGGDLSLVTGVMKGRRQVVDIPPVKPVYTEYQQYVKQCPCCSKLQSAPYPPDVTNHIQYGVNVQTAVVYNWLYQYLPFERLQKWFSDIFNLSIGKGTLENIIRKATRLAQPAYELIRQRLLSAKKVGSDETGMKVNGDKQWIWVWQNDELTFLYCSDNRGAATITTLFPDGFKLSVLVSDRWRAQLSTPAAGHQLCLAHLLRELQFIIEVEKECETAPKIKKVLQMGIEQKRLFPESQTSNETCIGIERELDNLLNVEIEKKQFPLTKTLQNSLLKHRNHIFVFLYHKDVPYENNGSERSIRMVKVKQKISGCFKSLQQDFCVLKSVVDTRIKKGQDAMTIIRNLIMLGHINI